jgi:hypothetical protein
VTDAYEPYRPQEGDPVSVEEQDARAQDFPNLVRLEQTIEEKGEEAVDPHLVLDAAADISRAVGEQLEEALYGFQVIAENFTAMMALMNKYHELAYHGHESHEAQKGDAE